MNGVKDDTCGSVFPGWKQPAHRCALTLRIALCIGAMFATNISPGQNMSRAFERPKEPPRDKLLEDPSYSPLDDEVAESLSGRAPRAASHDVPSALVEVRIEGNKTIEQAGISRYIKSRPGRHFDEKQVRADVKALYGTGWFASVEWHTESTSAGVILIFQVIERPIVLSVEYKGSKKIKTKHLEARTGIKRGSPFDVSKNREAARTLEDYYHEKGFAFATVELEKGGSMADRDVVFKINEGKKVRITSIKFDGNDSFSDQLLKTKIATKTAYFWYFGGKYDPTGREEDMAQIRKYYHSLGYFDVKITDRVAFNEDRSRAYLEYLVEEGVRYKIGKRELKGNRVYSEQELVKDLKLESGDYFNTRDLNKDLDAMHNKYYEQGRIFAKVEAVPVFYETPGVADIVYHIDEDKPYTIRMINVQIEGDNPHTKRSVVLNQMRIQPGDLANKKLINLSESRLRGSQYFMRDPAHQPRIEIRPVVPAFAEQAEPNIRGQNYDIGFGLSGSQHDESETDSESEGEPSDLDAHEGDETSEVRVLTTTSYAEPATRRRLPAPNRALRKPANQIADAELPFVSTGEMIPSAFYCDASRPYIDSAEAIIRAQNEEEYDTRGQSFEDGNVQPENPMFNPSPQGDPFGGGPQSHRFGTTNEADIDVIVQEERTGRLMFGVGINSDAGVVGSFVLSENNFDLFRPPTSVDDIVNGTAWRGAGQIFRLEAVPGTQVSRYMVSWTDPFVFNTNYSLGLSGFFYERFFEDWDEQRAGGRVQVGRQWTPYLSTSVALRAEEVVISNPKIPTPQQLQDVVGSNFLSTARFSVTHDTRDSAFLPGSGHMVELAYEQAFGEFTYPRAEAEARQYFTVYARPDGEGKHTITVGGNLGWTGDDTPIFENFFAGGFSSFRGFRFRGVGPKEFDVRVGGQWLALGSAEYMFPLLANEMVHGVVFSDFGTVQNDVGFDEFRMTAGAGLRVTIPAMGPVPLAFDFAAPIFKEDGDDTQVFSFYMGILR
jgi:outer membrane protein insertion porin family